MKVLATFILVVSLAFFAQAAFNDAVQQLSRFQDSQTGAFFSNVNSAPSLESTTDALFLYSLYGLGNKINSFQTEHYLQSLRTKENGFASVSDGPATLESTFNAVLSYVYLGKEVPQSSAVVKYVLSLVTEEKLFANTAGNRGNIKSTYHAIAILEALDSTSSLSTEVSNGVNNVIASALTTTDLGTRYYSFTNVPAIKSNFYGVFIWKALNKGATFPPSAIAEFVGSQQHVNGAFFADTQRTSYNYESSALALSTLGLLSDFSKDNLIATNVNVESLANYAKAVPVDLSETAFAHKAIAHTALFSENFKFVVEYGAADTRNSHVLQGTQLRPELTVKSFNGPSHSNLVVYVNYAVSGEASKTVRLNWDEDNQRYVAPQGIDTSNILGAIVFEYDIQLSVFGVAPVRFTQRTEKNVGYKISVVAGATHTLTGATINVGEAVSAGTEFEFDVKLANKTHSNIKAGNFHVALSVLDSSYVQIHRESLSAKANSDAFQFAYSLSEADIPSGELTFLVSVNDAATGKTYSNEFVLYTFSVPLIASEITFTNKNLVLGDDFSVSFVPATYADLRDVVALSAPEGNFVDNRKFFLDISSASGVVLRTLAAVHENGRYSFDFTVPANYDSLGSFVVSFRYETAKSQSIALDNFNSVAQEVFEEALSFEVKANLVAEILEKPTGTQFFYGNDVAFKFQVKDKLTNLPVALGEKGGVSLVLNHFDEAKGKSFVSAKLAAVQEGSDLVIHWKVNPNAVKGAGELVLIAEGPGGDEIPLLVNGKKFSTKVSVGGDIKENLQIFSSSDFFSSQTAFVVQFELSCNEVLLRDVKLRAVVFYGSEQIQSVSVGVSEDSYVASWNTLHADSPSGVYTVKFFREADQQRAAANEESKQKQVRIKQREAELNGTPFNAEKFLAGLDTVVVEPLFVVSIPHTQVSRGGLPFATQWLVLIPAFAGFLFFDNIKGQYRKGIKV